MGQAVALNHALRHPGRIERAVLLAPFAHAGDVMWKLTDLPNDSAAFVRHARARAERRDALDPARYCREFWGFASSPIEETRPAVVRALAPAICDAPPDRRLGRESIQRGLDARFGSWDWSDSIPRLDVPTVVIVGAGDPALVAGARVWAGRLPIARLLTAGRSPLFPWGEARGEVVAAIDGFFRDR